MKRKLFIVLALAVGLMVKAETLGNWTDYKADSFSKIDEGTNTITITSAAELALFAYNVNNEIKDGKKVSFKDYNVTLGEDLDLSGHYWIPIGTYYTAETFTGTFNGADHTISNLDVYVDGSETGNVAGLFGQIGEGGTVKDVTISGSYIGIQTPSFPSAACYIGGIAGINNGTIIGCANAALVACNESGARMGGIAGENNGTIQNCYNLGSVYTSKTDNHIGGIVGNNSGSVKNCFMRCTVTAGGGTGAETTTSYPLVGNNGGTVAGNFYANGSTSDALKPEILVTALIDNANNSTAISTAAAAGSGQNILLQDRTLFTDGGWNTICLPFSIPAGAEGYSPIAGAKVMTLSSSTFSDGTLTLNFTPATTIEAGKPYIVKWNTTIADDLVNPVFTSVTVSSTTTSVKTTCVDFIGTYSPIIWDKENKSILFLGAANTLYYPQPSGGQNPFINSCRAYFQLTDGNEVKSFVLNFGEGDDDTTGIINYQLSIVNSSEAAAWYTLDGRKIVNRKSSNRKMQKGLYINNGRKIVIK